MPPTPGTHGLEATTVLFAPVIGCAVCSWAAPIGHPNAHRLARRHAETNVGHMAYVESQRMRQYLVREVTR
jgi:hypothetical protein